MSDSILPGRLTVEPPEDREPRKRGRPGQPPWSWYRIVAPDGSTVAYTPDHVTAEVMVSRLERDAENTRLREALSFMLQVYGGDDANAAHWKDRRDADALATAALKQ